MKLFLEHFSTTNIIPIDPPLSKNTSINCVFPSQAYSNYIMEKAHSGKVSSSPLGESIINGSWLTHLFRVCIYASVKWVSIGSGNGLSPIRCQAITWTNADLLSIGPLGTNFSDIWIKCNFSFMKMYLKMLSATWQPFCPGRDGLKLHT